MRILMVLVPDAATAERAHLTMNRISIPYCLSTEAGVEVVMASPEGGAPHVRSEGASAGANHLFAADRRARDALADTLSTADIAPEDFEALFCVGLIDPIWEGAPASASGLVAAFLRSGKPAALLPGRVDIEPLGSAAGLLIFGEDDKAPEQAAAALLGILGMPRR